MELTLKKETIQLQIETNKLLAVSKFPAAVDVNIVVSSESEMRIMERKFVTRQRLKEERRPWNWPA